MSISPVGNQPVMSMIMRTVTDGSIQVIISYSPTTPVSGQPLSIALTFIEDKGNLIRHQNYAISVIQEGNDHCCNNSLIQSHITGADNKDRCIILRYF
jgi:hypothetical protein